MSLILALVQFSMLSLHAGRFIVNYLVNLCICSPIISLSTIYNQISYAGRFGIMSFFTVIHVL